MCFGGYFIKTNPNTIKNDAIIKESTELPPYKVIFILVYLSYNFINLL